LGRMGSEDAVGRLIELAESRDPETKVAAAAGLVEAGETGIPLIVERMKRAGPELSRLLEAVLAAHRQSEAQNLHH